MSTKWSPPEVKLPGWLAVALTLALAVGGFLVGGLYFPISVVLGGVITALLAERSAFFTVAVQPPVITAVVVAGAVLLGRPLLDAATQLAATFPYLAGTMVAVILILVIRARTTPAHAS